MEGVAYRLAPEQTPARRTGLPPHAKLYLLACAALAAASAVVVLAGASPTREAWLLFLPLVLAGSVAHVFATHLENHQVFHVGLVFTVAAVLLLPPELVLLACVVPHCVDWIRQRYAWYIQTFNVCNFALSALAAYGAVGLAERLIGAEAPDPRLGMVAAATFVVVNHALLARMLVLARGRRAAETGLFSIDGAMPDLVLALLGAGTAIALDAEPWALPIVLAPLVLIHRSLGVRELLTLARTDPKTGLFNYRHFTNTLGEELVRAERFGRPLSVVLADLDHLRTINNEHGHLAGDAVLAGIADVLRAELRTFDVAARFGGEEFVILLPEAADTDAAAIAERIRAAVAGRNYAAKDGEPLHATVSIGHASFPQHARDAEGLLREADTALYAAKRRGRNLVLSAGALTGARRG